MAARKKSAKSAKPTAKKKSKTTAKKKAAAASPPSPVPPPPAGDPRRLRGPVMVFTALTITAFVLIYFIYAGAGLRTAPRVVHTESDAAGERAFVEGLQVRYEKKDVSVPAPARDDLRRVVAYLQSNSRQRLRIVGYTCNIGTPEDNVELSEQRAKVVRDFLIAAGAPEDRLDFEGAGESDPVASNSSEAGRIRNRRVEFRLQ